MKELLEALSQTLGYDNKTEMFLVGAGSLGRALLRYKKFQDYNIGIAAAFDVNEDVIGSEIDNKPVLPLTKFSSLCKRMHVKLRHYLRADGIGAGRGRRSWYRSGIKAIWNFAPITLDVPDTVIVHNENLTASLSILLKKYKTRISGSERE